jgi:hypothetical protein
MPEGYFTCHSCGKRVRYGTEERPCQVLNGWLMVSKWEGLRAVEHYNFCCFTCLKTWTDSQVPQIPAVFLKAFEEGKD